MAVLLKQWKLYSRIDPVASSSGYHEPMSQYWIYENYELGAKVLIYDIETALLVFSSDSVQYIAEVFIDLQFYDK